MKPHKPHKNTTTSNEHRSNDALTRLAELLGIAKRDDFFGRVGLTVSVENGQIHRITEIYEKIY